jgi:opine dehydrogenase
MKKKHQPLPDSFPFSRSCWVEPTHSRRGPSRPEHVEEGETDMLPYSASTIATSSVATARSRRFPDAHRTRSVAVLGAGHGGMALAGWLSRHGHRVRLWNRSPEHIEAVRAGGAMALTLPDRSVAAVRLAAATSHMGRALEDVDVVLVAVPASGHADVARAAAPHLRDGQTVLLLPGRTGGALEFQRVLRDAGCWADIVLGEANTFPLAARRTGPASATIFGTKSEVLAASLPSARNGELLDACRPILPRIAPCRSVLQTGLANIGAILHPVIALGNAERIRRGEWFDFYADGVTDTVAQTLASADAERLRIARAYGVAVDSLIDWIGTAYGHHADTVREAVGGNPAYVGITAPTTLEHRYLLEDVPTGLIPLLELGRAAGLRLPTLAGLVDAARFALGGVRWQRPRTLAALGLTGMSPDAISTWVRGQRMPDSRFAAISQRAGSVSDALHKPVADASGAY